MFREWLWLFDLVLIVAAVLIVLVLFRDAQHGPTSSSPSTTVVAPKIPLP